ncbi:MAG: maleylacetoacetate isomerase [Myxococcales bacterium]|nr:maleylacetoacetate isomerase [Myxococcales bacterium]
MSPTRLYSYYRSSCSWRVRIALALKGVDYEYVAVNLVRGGGEQHGQDYREKNPLAQVPTLEIDGARLTQSVAIIEYLDETRPTPPLLPDSAAERALVRSVVETINAGIQPLQNLGPLLRIGIIADNGEAEKIAWARHYISVGFDALERQLAPVSRGCVLGEQITIADLFLVPQVYNARRFGLDLAAYPTLSAIDARLADQPAFVAAHPERQPDYPERS